MVMNVYADIKQLLLLSQLIREAKEEVEARKDNQVGNDKNTQL